MIATQSLELYVAALRSDATTLMQRIGFDDRYEGQHLLDLVDGCYRIELMVIVQLVRWYEIGLVRAHEIDVPPPGMLMVDLRRRIAESPNTYRPSFIMNGTIERMIAWWTDHTITSSWRSVKAHVRIAGDPADSLFDALADFLWEVRDAVAPMEGKCVAMKEEQS